MERAVAHKKITQLLGKKWGWHMNKGAPGAETRQEAHRLFLEVNAKRNELSIALQAKREAVLAADPGYQKILAAYRVAREEAEHLSGLSRHYKFTVGRDEGLFFHVHAEGDSWEEVIEKLKQKKKEGA